MKDNSSKKRFADRNIEQFIGLQLRFGVLIASLMVLIGGTIYLLQSGDAHVPYYHVFIGAEAGYTNILGIITVLKHLNPKGIIQTGILLVIATPILRVAFSLIGFIIEKDRLYIMITLVVLSVMIFSILGGIKG